MFLEELLAEKPASSGDIASWAAQAFGIGVAAILVEPEDDRGGPLGDAIELLVEVGETPGDFPADEVARDWPGLLTTYQAGSAWTVTIAWDSRTSTTGHIAVHADCPPLAP